MAEEMFNKYRRQDNKERILLLYLILNNYDLDKVECAVETVQNKMFGVELRKIYGVTSEFVDVQRIEAELAEIHTPVICSMQSYELYSNTEVIHTYMPKESNKPLYINDMLDKVAEGKDNIVLGTDTVIGLYDRMNGAGSDFEIQLEEDMVIPTTMVQIVQMESSGRSDVVSSKDNIGYSVDDTYDFVGTQWQDSYKGITDKAPTLVQENMKETYEKLNNFEPEKGDVIKDDKEDDFGLD